MTTGKATRKRQGEGRTTTASTSDNRIETAFVVHTLAHNLYQQLTTRSHYGSPAYGGSMPHPSMESFRARGVGGCWMARAPHSPPPFDLPIGPPLRPGMWGG